MTRKTVVLPVLFVGFMTVLACVTINVYFPEKEISDYIDKIENEVEKVAVEGEEATTQEKVAGEGTENEKQADRPTSNLLEGIFGITPAYAQDIPEPEITNPAIRKIIASRQERRNQLDRFKKMGVIGENNRALLEIRDLENLPDLKARAAVQRLVQAENADREELFREIAAAKGVDPSQIPRIRENYAERLRARAEPGDWLQMPDGNWKRK